MLEILLNEYIQTGQLSNNCYNQLKYLAASICKKNKVNNQQYENGVVDDMVSEVIITLPQYYDKSKGTLKGACYKLMSQYLIRQYKHLMAEKRGVVKTVYLEDISKENEPLHILEIELTSEFYKRKLSENKSVILKLLKNTLTRKIGKHIINAILNPEKYKESNHSFTGSIAKHCHCSNQMVYKAINELKRQLYSLDYTT